MLYRCLEASPGELWDVGASIEQSGGGMGEPLLRQQVVSLDGCINVTFVNPDRHPHQHVLGSLGN